MDTIEKEKVSVIMLAQDCGQFLEASVKSVMAQTLDSRRKGLDPITIEGR